MSFERYALVTGATKGIGRAIAERLLQENYHVIGNYAHDDAAANSMMNEVAYRERLTLIRQSLSSYQDSEILAEQVREVCNEELDIIVCNSGTTDTTPFPQITPEGWAQVMDTNLNAPFFLIQGLSNILAAERGRVILIGSSMGQYPHARSISYGVSKSALQALARYLVKYLSVQGITVNCIMPGFINTSWQAGKEPAHRKRIEDKISLHRFGAPQEVAELCMCIIRDQFINGSVLTMDGGYCCE